MLAFCSFSSTVMPCWFTVRMISKISRTTMGARPRLGSSSMSSFGLLIRARPTASICCSPPERVPALCQLRSFRRGNRLYTHSRSFSVSALSLRRYAPIFRFSSTVRSANTRRPSGDMAMPLATIWSMGLPSSSCPFHKMEPLCAFTRPEMVRIRVDLPAPLAPIRVTILPSGTFSDTPRKA